VPGTEAGPMPAGATAMATAVVEAPVSRALADVEAPVSGALATATVTEDAEASVSVTPSDVEAAVGGSPGPQGRPSGAHRRRGRLWRRSSS